MQNQDSIESIIAFDLDRWSPDPAAVMALSEPSQQGVEHGAVLYFPGLSFDLEAAERVYLNPAYADEKRKSIYIRPGQNGVLGTAASAADQAALLRMIQRYQTASMGLVARLFPGYVGQMKAAGTSFRPRAIGSGEAALSWRKDDTRLHVDAFPSNPTNGMRILRVFTNIGTTPRQWRVGEAFEAVAQHFLPRIRGPLPGSAQLLHALRVTKRRRSAYDHYMLQLHDAAKADLQYQKECAQLSFGFPPGSSWVCYSDQVMHAAMSGQFMMEQTIHVPPAALAYPERAPLAILQRLVGRPLLDRLS
jgi:hypothetical protein